LAYKHYVQKLGLVLLVLPEAVLVDVRPSQTIINNGG
jgi:hypothetical protein